MKKLIRQILALVFLSAATSFAASYYISSTGNDSNTGITAANAWATIAKIKGAAIAAGDSILFEGGKSFSGPLEFTGNGTAEKYILIGPYGTGRAAIIGGTGNAVTITNSSYLIIRNINVLGQGILESSDRRATGIRVSGGSYITVDSVEACGFLNAGVEVSNCSFARITHVYTHENGYAGIRTSRGVANLYIGFCRANHNPGYAWSRNISGSGIEVMGATNSMIEYCEAAYNGGHQNPSVWNGPVGLWLAGSDHDTIQYCIAHDNTSNTADGGGFDLDAQVWSCVLQYCYSYNNKSYGIQFWQWSGNQWLENNIVRYNIFDSDGGNAVWIGHNASSATGVRNNDIYNNLIINKFLCVGVGGTNVSGIRLYNNIFYGIKSANLFSGFTSSQCTLLGNCYWSENGSFDWWGYRDLSQFANAANQEKVNAKIAGIYAHPQFDFPAGERITDPAKLPQLTSFLLKPTSPCINKGIDLKTVCSKDPGTRDFWGNTIPQKSSFDIGPNECTNPFKLSCIIVSPTNNQPVFPVPKTVNITANAWSIGPESIKGISFYQGTTKIGDGRKGESGWTCVWKKPAQGSYALTAQVLDNQKQSTTFSAGTIIIGCRTPENPANAKPGVQYRYFEESWASMPDLGNQTPVKSGISDSLQITAPVANREDNYGIRFTGFVDIPTDGVYTFYCNADDGAMLFIGNTLVVDNGGPAHAPREKSGINALAKGTHAFTIDFFEAGGGETLAMSWECATAGIAKQPLPWSRLSYVKQ